ncbi:hypothetical protein Cob_v009831 [Colletotrichum orbiculare MAFF 240422]|uniref:Uncharacterized protein n=1 Tax=Colletotrichum orbiculare (strain 104-T / ATCC 96160 / CBS 514.97 / LARS 414 / MAFF 240422) TaxID=1213857 RepID=A0A484FHR6_COLOR|nr:hypothetical protein Cob_v009831 [Colletotrichum orbiculare MAFF 240422]
MAVSGKNQMPDPDFSNATRGTQVDMPMWRDATLKGALPSETLLGDSKMGPLFQPAVAGEALRWPKRA